MAKRRFAVRPVEPLILEFADGTEKEVAMTIDALMILTEEFGDLSDLMARELTKPIDLAAKILYAGIRVNDTTITLEEAKNIVLGGGLPLQLELMDILTESLGTVSETDLKKTISPIVTKMLQKKKQTKQ